jgi:diguanylate cyclase (GGDEF)-like protein/PAS domain S-box-containing protein
MNAAPYQIGQMRLPLRAAAFVALVCIIIPSMAAVREWRSRSANLSTAEISLGNLARSLTQHVEDSFDLLDASILGVVSRLETEGADPTTLEKLRQVLVARKEHLKLIDALLICDANGNWLASSGLTGANLSDREYFKHHQQSPSRDAFVGPAVKSKGNGEWITTLSHRFNHPDGSFAGVVVATVRARYFSDFYGQFDIGTAGTITLIGTDGTIHARRPDNGTVGLDVSDGPFLRGIGTRSPWGVFYFRSALDRIQRLGFFERSQRYPFIILATKAQDEVLSAWRSAAIVRACFVLGLVALIAIIGFRLVGQLKQGQRLAVALASKEAGFRMLAEGSSDMVTRIGLDERFSYVSPSSVRIVGWQPDQLVGTSVLAHINPGDLPAVQETVAMLRRGKIEEARITYRSRHREKSEIWVESTLRVTRKVDGKVDGVIAITRDVTEHKDIEERLEALAIEDGLTGLANRRRFDERLDEEWRRAMRERTWLGLLMIDLDHFKKYNDAYGHLAGDECLRSVARVLAAEAQRTTDLAARFGGEEFVILLPNTDAAGCARIGERFRRALGEAALPHALNHPSGRVTVSLGGAVCRPNDDSAAEPTSLIDAADRALYAAKNGGRDRLVMSDDVSIVGNAAELHRMPVLVRS